MSKLKNCVVKWAQLRTKHKLLVKYHDEIVGFYLNQINNCKRFFFFIEVPFDEKVLLMKGCLLSICVFSMNDCVFLINSISIPALVISTYLHRTCLQRNFSQSSILTTFPKELFPSPKIKFLISCLSEESLHYFLGTEFNRLTISTQTNCIQSHSNLAEKREKILF